MTLRTNTVGISSCAAAKRKAPCVSSLPRSPTSAAGQLLFWHVPVNVCTVSRKCQVLCQDSYYYYQYQNIVEKAALERNIDRTLDVEVKCKMSQSGKNQGNKCYE